MSDFIRNVARLAFGFGLVALSCSTAWAQSGCDVPILTGAVPASGIAIGVDTSDAKRDWLTAEGTADLLMRYPGPPSAWGAVFLTQGPAVTTGRQVRDLSACTTLSLEMNGDPDSSIEVGIKDSTQPDNGTEAKVSVRLTADWQTFQIPLSKFSPPADLKRVYVLLELVFGGAQGQTVRLRNVRYSGGIVTSHFFPQFAFGGGWYSAMYLTNLNDSPVAVPVTFIDDQGRSLPVPSVGGSSTVLNLERRATGVIEAQNIGGLSQGYVAASLPDGVVGHGIFRQSIPGLQDQEAVVPLSSASTVTSTLIFDDTSFATAFSLVNTSSINIVVNVVVRDQSGQTIGTAVLPLAAKNKLARFLKELPGLSVVTGKRGSVDFTATAGTIAVLGLRFNGSAITSIPTADR